MFTRLPPRQSIRPPDAVLSSKALSTHKMTVAELRRWRVKLQQVPRQRVSWQRRPHLLQAPTERRVSERSAIGRKMMFGEFDLVSTDRGVVTDTLRAGERLPCTGRAVVRIRPPIAILAPVHFAVMSFDAHPVGARIAADPAPISRAGTRFSTRVGAGVFVRPRPARSFAMNTGPFHFPRPPFWNCHDRPPIYRVKTSAQARASPVPRPQRGR